MLDFVSHIYTIKMAYNPSVGKVQSIISNLTDFSAAYLHQQIEPTN